MSQPGPFPDFSRPFVVYMTRLSVRYAVPMLMLALSACFDRSNAAPSADRAATGDVSRDSAHHVVHAGVTAITAAAAAARKETDTNGTTKAEAPPPSRNHRDSVALASMTKPDSVLDRKWPVKMPEPLAGAIFPTNRVVAYYCNPLSKKMGVLGE